MAWKSHHKLRQVSLGATTLLLLFLLAEGSLRLAGVNPRVDNPFFMLVRVFEYPDYFKKDHNLFWRLRPNIEEGTEFLVPGSYRTNSLGLRGPELSPIGAERQIRIACFGNSCTFGWRLEENQTYEKQTERMLNSGVRPEGFSAVNCGIPGYSSFQGFLLLKEYFRVLEPSVVTICYGWNDHWAAGFDIADKDQQMPAQWILDVQNLLSDSYLYRGLKYLLLSKYEKSQQYQFDRKSVHYRVSLADYAANLGEIIAFCRANDAIPILITAPCGDQDPGVINPMEEYHERYNNIVRRIAADLDVALVDAAEVFTKHPEYYDNPRADFIHYNARGAERIAAELAETIRRLPSVRAAEKN